MSYEKAMKHSRNVPEKLTSNRADFSKRVNYAAQFCVSRAGTGNSESTRALCNCIESDDGEQVLAALVRRAHKNSKLEAGIRLLFVFESLNNAAKRFGINPLDAQKAKEGFKK